MGAYPTCTPAPWKARVPARKPGSKLGPNEATGRSRPRGPDLETFRGGTERTCGRLSVALSLPQCVVARRRLLFCLETGADRSHLAGFSVASSQGNCSARGAGSRHDALQQAGRPGRPPRRAGGTPRGLGQTLALSRRLLLPPRLAVSGLRSQGRLPARGPSLPRKSILRATGGSGSCVPGPARRARAQCRCLGGLTSPAELSPQTQRRLSLRRGRWKLRMHRPEELERMPPPLGRQPRRQDEERPGPPGSSSAPFPGLRSRGRLCPVRLPPGRLCWRSGGQRRCCVPPTPGQTEVTTRFPPRWLDACS